MVYALNESNQLNQSNQHNCFFSIAPHGRLHGLQVTWMVLVWLGLVCISNAVLFDYLFILIEDCYTQAERFPFWFYIKLLQKVWVMSLGDFNMENPSGLPILPHLRRQISSRIGDYSAKTSSLYLQASSTIAQLGLWVLFRRYRRS